MIDYESNNEPIFLVTVHEATSIVPLSSYGKPFTPPAGKVEPAIDMKKAVREQVNELTATEYFSLFAKLLEASP